MAVSSAAVQPRPSIPSRSLSLLADSRNALGFGFM
ncbi:MAG: sugar ABC transporter permease, partial [Mesorhizobium sp.]